jgi:hypothetical protein
VVAPALAGGVAIELAPPRVAWLHGVRLASEFGVAFVPEIRDGAQQSRNAITTFGLTLSLSVGRVGDAALQRAQEGDQVAAVPRRRDRRRSDVPARARGHARPSV